MEDPAVFINFLRNNLGVTTQLTIYIIMNFVESFGDLLVLDYGDIDTFVKDTHSENHASADAQIILISNNFTQGSKHMFFELKYRAF